MVPYGVPKEKNASDSDRTNILCYGLKPYPDQTGKYGETRDTFRNTAIKKKIRRLWKKRERLSAKTMIANEV